ncbi:coiled-coil domain-containing protein [Aurantiacibacter gangjinensis]|uniref:Uncharacterized protein n=1 Tax=Aurantiacibacter gangjinensis TaxID=502682 RepID=A0A0G9MTF4_9SPHN|nr:hypothetical protein [Aurantiacibacter gangjinensis]APE28374.1 hypothetical protein BMF35_a1545 [Aurantiacibacter gangjinensis]KLE32603.1 hypothetical protein AAW01_00595 [Aurantiacibacter gangjinensis]
MSEVEQQTPKSRQQSILDDASAEIDDGASGVPAIPYYLVEKQGNKTTKLLSNSGTDTSIQAKNRWHTYEFKNPLFICFVDIEGDEISDADEYRFRVTLEDGSEKELKGRPKSGKLRIDINEFCVSIAFKPPSIFWSVFRRTPEIQRVSLWGFYKENLGEFLHKISRINSIKLEAKSEISEIKDDTDERILVLAKKESELEAIDQDIEDTRSNLEKLNAAIAEKESVDSELQAKLDRTDAQLEKLIEQVSERRAELDTVTKSRENGKQEVEESKAELKKLQDNINLFPSEISGFVEQASNDIRTYNLYYSGLVAIICILFIWILTGSYDLSEWVKENPDRSVWPLLLAKLPLAIAVSALVTACYKIAKVFVAKILDINDKKLSLTQISIIAKDLSQSAEAGLQLSAEKSYAFRLRTKMAMLGDHINTFVKSEPNTLFPDTLFSDASDPNETLSREPESEAVRDEVDSEDDNIT